MPLRNVLCESWALYWLASWCFVIVENGFTYNHPITAESFERYMRRNFVGCHRVNLDGSVVYIFILWPGGGHKEMRRCLERLRVFRRQTWAYNQSPGADYLLALIGLLPRYFSLFNIPLVGPRTFEDAEEEINFLHEDSDGDPDFNLYVNTIQGLFSQQFNNVNTESPVNPMPQGHGYPYYGNAGYQAPSNVNYYAARSYEHNTGQGQYLLEPSQHVHVDDANQSWSIDIYRDDAPPDPTLNRELQYSNNN